LEQPQEADYVRFANGIGVDSATISAVLDVEAREDSGFLRDGRPKILFERHIFSSRTGHRFDATNPTVSNPSPGGYEGGALEYERLKEAFELDSTAALESASWGRMQMMGFNYKRNGFETVGEFVRFLSISEASQLDAGILGYIRTDKRLTEALRDHDWRKVAFYFNGPRQVDIYASKLSGAYNLHLETDSAKFAASGALSSTAKPAGSPGVDKVKNSE
jgi:hypothetical protein